MFPVEQSKEDRLETLSRRRTASIARQKAVQKIMDERFTKFRQSQLDFFDIQSEYLSINNDIHTTEREMELLRLSSDSGKERGETNAIPETLSYPVSQIPFFREIPLVMNDRAEGDSISIVSGHSGMSFH